MNKKTKSFLALLTKSHGKYVFNRRTRVLSSEIAKLLPKDVSTILDVGCGDGTVGYLLKTQKPQIKIKGLEIMRREQCLIPYTLFDGKRIKSKDNTFDACMLVDVLHHEKDILQLLKETARVSKKYIIIKDHLNENKLDNILLSFMDWVGNKGYGVGVIYNYPSKKSWKKYISDAGLQIKNWDEDIPLYPFPFNLLFGKKMHVLTVLEKKKNKS